MSCADLLIADDRCHRQAHLMQRWQRRTVHPIAALYDAIDAGLTYTGEEDPGAYAGDILMGIAVDRGLDTDQPDLLGHATHYAALADFITWTLRSVGAWKRPPAEGAWDGPSTYAAPGGLRRVVLVDRWDDARAEAEALDWRTRGDSAIYGLPVMLMVVVLGASREGRRIGPLSRAYVHPRSHQIRFAKRDGTDFTTSWERTWREEWLCSREEWHAAMQEDGVLSDCLQFEEVEVPAERERVRLLALAKLTRARLREEMPEPHFSQCFDPIHPCQFRSCCPRYMQPATESGFLSVPR